MNKLFLEFNEKNIEYMHNWGINQALLDVLYDRELYYIKDDLYFGDDMLFYSYQNELVYPITEKDRKALSSGKSVMIEGRIPTKKDKTLLTESGLI